MDQLQGGMCIKLGRGDGCRCHLLRAITIPETHMIAARMTPVVRSVS